MEKALLLCWAEPHTSNFSQKRLPKVYSPLEQFRKSFVAETCKKQISRILECFSEEE
jgi:hypothetical protein